MAHSHPISQGILDVYLQLGQVDLHLESPLEGLVAASGRTEEQVLADLPRMKSGHGKYLLSHFALRADGKLLSGDIFPGPGRSESNKNEANWLTYRFVFPAEKSARQLVISQDVLAGLIDAQGQPWTASYLATVHFPDSGQEMHLLTREQDLQIALPNISEPIQSKPQSSITLDYVKHGIWHILTGYDHMLFMAALVLAATTWWDLVKVVSAFTLAHTVTLTLSVLHIFRLSSGIVEPMIAASIVFVAMQNIVSPKASRGWSRLFLAFGFGLFHGLGFAGGLLEAMEGLAGVTVATAILAFSAGVELGHQCVVIPLFGALQIGKKLRFKNAQGFPSSALAIRYGSLLIAVAGSYFLFMALRG